MSDLKPAFREPKKTLQQFADENVDPKYRQPLKTAQQVAETLGWADPEAPTCCGEPVAIRSMIGSPYYAECAKKCGKFAASMDGPHFSNGGGVVQFLDPDKVDVETEARWIVGHDA